MPTKTPKKRTAAIVPKKSTKRHAAVVKKVSPTTLITGGTGFLGAHLVRQLVDSGAKDIRVMATSIPEWLADLGVDTFEGSVTNEDDVASALEGVTDIYHLAGRVSRDKDDSREMYKLHVDGTRLLCDAAKKAGNNSIGVAADITDPAQVRAAFDKAVAVFGGVDILVSNAGAAWEGRIGELDDALLRKSFELNFFAHQSVAQNAVRIMLEQGTGGVLLFNTSKQAVNPGPKFGAYGVPKAATLFLSRQYALDYGAHGIRSNAVNADRIRSGILTDAMIASRSGARGVSEKEYMSGNLLGQEVTAQDVAQAFLHHALAERTTADVTTVDGGNIAAALR